MTQEDHDKLDFCYRAIKALCREFDTNVLTEVEEQEYIKQINQKLRVEGVASITKEILEQFRTHHDKLWFTIPSGHAMSFSHLETYRCSSRDSFHNSTKDSISIPAGQYKLELVSPMTVDRDEVVTISNDDGLFIKAECLEDIVYGIYDEHMYINGFLPVSGTCSSPEVKAKYEKALMR